MNRLFSVGLDRRVFEYDVYKSSRETELVVLTEYINNFKLSEYYNNIYQFLIDPTEEKFKKTITGYLKPFTSSYACSKSIWSLFLIYIY